jgi:hypothetical protein
MITRCASAQLRYSVPAPVGMVVAMLLIYLAPPVLALASPPLGRLLGARRGSQ